ncbi:MAG: hypothetical protein ABS24_04575 [SAR92 bacterium BACL26 MAG-121220-bin70]|jgi:hypothetical protein|uniref:Uncharacterized protein n=1 Tax=SAR92 bacterium BACL26 MAG-121220-bin70 TaxID=1655626 RepID=A0A0R2U7I7_9GAMM|nr:MAG: hypothetical protein ABS24_04575 [SAR92 bacterium BACL26 MAG-121220-bin70]
MSDLKGENIKVAATKINTKVSIFGNVVWLDISYQLTQLSLLSDDKLLLLQIHTSFPIPGFNVMLVLFFTPVRVLQK